MVQQHVVVVDHREQVGMRRAGQDRGRASGGSRRSSKPGRSSQPGQHTQIHGPRHRVDVAGLDLEALAENPTQLLRCRSLDLQPDDVAAPPPADLPFDELEMRPAALVVEIELRVARQADERRFQDGLAGEQLRQVRSDDLLEQDERVPRVSAAGTRRGRPGGTWTIASRGRVSPAAARAGAPGSG